MELYKPKLIRSSVTLYPEDFKYLKENNLKASRLIRDKIKEHRENYQPSESSVKLMAKKIEGLANVQAKLMAFIEKKGLSDEVFKLFE